MNTKALAVSWDLQRTIQCIAAATLFTDQNLLSFHHHPNKKTCCGLCTVSMCTINYNAELLFLLEYLCTTYALAKTLK